MAVKEFRICIARGPSTQVAMKIASKASSSLRAVAFVLLALFGAASLASAAEPFEQARTLLEKYVALYHAFDPAVADLYADDAAISNRRTYPTGEVRVLSLTGTQYK